MKNTNQYHHQLARAPNCRDPEHPGCVHCADEPDPSAKRRLTEDAQADYDSFLTTVEGCTCWKAPPCSYCTHDGHPLRLLALPASWQLSLDERFSTYEEIYSHAYPTNVSKLKP